MARTATASPLCLLLAAGLLYAQAERPTPALDLRTRTPEFVGPGREAPPPADLAEIAIAFFGPDDPQHVDFGEAWRGASLAIDEANATGGCHGLPFRLVSAWSDNPWNAGASALARLVYGQGAWAVLGGMDGATTHLAEQVAVKARLPLVNPAGTDPSVHFTNIAWMFTVVPTDDQIAPVLVGALVAQNARDPWAVVTTTDRDMRVAWHALEKELAVHQHPAPVLHLILPPRSPEYASALADIANGPARAVVVLADARDSARLIQALHQAGFSGRIVGGTAVGRRAYLRVAGAAAEGVVFPLLFDAITPEAAAFVRAYRRRWNDDPDTLAAHSYDAAGRIVEAVRRAGPNRALVRDALAAATPWTGATGTVAWDPTGRTTRSVVLGVWRDGRIERAH